MNISTVPIIGPSGTPVTEKHAELEIEQRVSASLTYIGHSHNLSALHTDPVWQIFRIRKIGDTTYTTPAQDGGYTCQWSARASYFSDSGLLVTTSLLFDGTNDAVSYGNKFNYGEANAWSFSAWLKVDNYASVRCIYSKTTNDANVYGWNFTIQTTGKINVQVRGTGGLTSTNFDTVVPTGTWFHFCFTYAGGSNTNGIRIYINGVVDTVPGSSAFSGILASQTAYLGLRNTVFGFSGKMAQVSIWDKSLSSTEVSEIYNSGVPTNIAEHSAVANLVSWYTFANDSPGTNIADEMGLNNGTMINMAGAENFTDDVP